MSFNFIQVNKKLYVELGELNLFLKENNLPILKIKELEGEGVEK